MKDGRSLSTISKPLGDTGLFEDRVGGVSGLDLLIDDAVVIRDRTEPDLVITLSLSVEAAGVVAQDSFEFPAYDSDIQDASVTSSCRWKVDPAVRSAVAASS